MQHWGTIGTGVDGAPDYECSARVWVQHRAIGAALNLVPVAALVLHWATGAPVYGQK